jgi:hypothetical protein
VTQATVTERATGTAATPDTLAATGTADQATPATPPPGPPHTNGAAGGAWERLLGVALLGTERRGGEPGALLAEAATETLRRRAGATPATAAPLPGPAPGDPRPALPPAARRRLATLLADRAAGGGRRGAAPNLAELLPQWLTAANAHGWAAPPGLLPELLDTARARTDLRADALAFAGPRATWLAGLNPEWRYVLRAPATGPGPGRSAPVPGDAAAHRRVWEEGLFAERTALLARLRAADPASALELLRSTWSTERAEDRLLFLDTLRAGIGPADEPFLEQALTDRSRNVRAAAAELLSALPGSALGARMADRATRCVRLEDGGEGGGEDARVAVTAPAACDAAMERDGVVPVPPSGRGERAWWLGQLVEAAPLGAWEATFGGLPPERIVALPVGEGWRGDLHAAWSRAAVRQRDARWARALLGPAGGTGGKGGTAGGEGGAASADPAKLLSVLPEGERAAWVAGFVAAHGLSEAFQALAVCAVPWPRELGRAVVNALDIARDAGSYPWSFSGVMGLAERCLDPAEADRAAPLTALAAPAGPAAPGSEGAAEPVPGAAGYWTEAFQRLVGTLRLRAAMLAELAEPAEPA